MGEDGKSLAEGGSEEPGDVLPNELGGGKLSREARKSPIIMYC